MRKVELDEYKSILTDILVKIDNICRENNIPYFLYAGTLLGAVRHQGFIPWDDDVDIAMFREDYDRLADIIHSGDYGINFIRIEENPDTIYPYGKICDTNTRLDEHNFKHVENYGAFIDVFPLDYMPNSEKERARLQKKYLNTVKLIEHSARTGYTRAPDTVTNVKRFAAFWLGKAFNVHKLVRKLNDTFIAMNAQKTDYVGLPWDTSYPVRYFSETVTLPFEQHELSVPKCYDEALRLKFGDYMQLPPESERVCKHTLDCCVND